MVIIEPHIHMFSRTTDEYCAMYNAGIRACVEPSFWLGANREYAGSFFDYFKIILDFETVRAARFGIDHYAAISVNPKEAEDLGLAREVIAGLDRFLAHERCLAVGEIGLNNITENEAKVFAEQLEIAKNKNLPVIIHLPHFNKPKGIDWTAQIVKDSGKNCGKLNISACDPNDRCESENCSGFYATLSKGNVTIMFVSRMGWKFVLTLGILMNFLSKPFQQRLLFSQI